MDFEAYPNNFVGDTGSLNTTRRTFSVASAHGMQRILSSSSNGSTSTSNSNYSSGLSPITPVDTGDMMTAGYYGNSNCYNSYASNSADYSFYPDEYSPPAEILEDDEYTLETEGYYGHGSYSAASYTAGMTPSPTSDNTPRSHYANNAPSFEASASSGGGAEPGGVHVCLHPGCDKGFKRKADLERHYDQKHTPAHLKKHHLCDYPKCSRRNEPFHRLDHYRDHFRDFHKEDLPRKKGESRGWYEDRNVRAHWWRCPKCLERRYVDKDGWDCLPCGSRCDAARRQMREGM